MIPGDARRPSVLSGSRRPALTRLAAERNDREHEARRARGGLVDRLVRDHQLCVLAELVPGVRVPVVLREVAAGDLELDAVPLPEDVAGGPEIHVELVGL